MSLYRAKFNFREMFILLLFTLLLLRPTVTRPNKLIENIKTKLQTIRGVKLLSTIDSDLIYPMH